MPATHKIKSNLDLFNHQLINVVMEHLAAHPANPRKGRIYMNTTENLAYYFDGTVWLVLGGKVAGGDALTATTANGVTTLDLNVDNLTLEISGDQVHIKDGGVDTAQLANEAVTTIKVEDKAIVFSKLQDLSQMTVMGSLAGGTPEEIAIINTNDMSGASASSLATSGSVKAYIDATIANIGSLKGGFDAAANTNLPGTGTTKKGDYWYVTTAGSAQGITFNIGDVIIANKAAASATNANDYIFLESNRDQATTTVLGLVKLATNAEVQAGTDANKVVTPAGLSSRTATESRSGLAEIATQAETDAGTDDSRIVTPKKLKAFYDANSGGFVANIGDAASLVFNVAHPLNTKDVIVTLYDATSGHTVHVSEARPDNATVVLEFGDQTVPSLNQYRVLIKKVA